MNKKVEFKNYKNFLDLYFTQSFDYTDLTNLAKEFRFLSGDDAAKEFLEELNAIKELDDWQYISDYTYEHGMRRLRGDKLKNMINIIIKELSDKSWDRASYKSFFKRVRFPENNNDD